MYQTRTTTQTATQAKRLASRIGAELLQVHAIYGRPTEEHIEKLIVEAETYLASGFLDKVRYGFKRNGVVVFELVYTAAEATGINDKPGRIPPDADLDGTTWFSYLTESPSYAQASDAQKKAFQNGLPLQRTYADAPEAAAGSFTVGSKFFSEDTLGLRREVRRT